MNTSELSKRASLLAYQQGDPLHNLCPFKQTKDDSVKCHYFLLGNETKLEDGTTINIMVVKEQIINLEDREIEIPISKASDLEMTDQILSLLAYEYKGDISKRFLNHIFSLKSVNPLLKMNKEVPKTGFWNFIKSLFKKKKVEPIENQHTLIRRVVSKILAAGNMVASNGRRGPANAIICNGCVAVALQDSAIFCYAPSNNQILSNVGGLYSIGSFAGMSVYVDPYMKWNDNRALVGRFSTEEDGVKLWYNPDKLKIAVVADGTKAPVMRLTAKDQMFFAEDFDKQIEICEFNIDLI